MNLPAILRASRDEGLITNAEYHSITMKIIDAPAIPKKDTGRKGSCSKRYVEALRNLQPGKALQVETARDAKIAHMAAKRNGISVITRKVGGVGFVVWKQP